MNADLPQSSHFGEDSSSKETNGNWAMLLKVSRKLFLAFEVAAYLVPTSSNAKKLLKFESFNFIFNSPFTSTLK